MQIPYNYKAQIIKVVDGDTVDALIDVGFKLTTVQRIRLLGVNTPELHDKDLMLRAKAIEAKGWLTAVLLNQSVILHTEKSDVFGRYLAYIYLEERNINEEIAKMYPYTG